MASDKECVIRKQETSEVGVLRYQDLIVWQKAMDLVIRVYELSDGFPRRETFGLTNQLRRSAISIPSNIAEGQARQTTQDFLRFLSIAQGSSQELETQILIAFRLTLSEGSREKRTSRNAFRGWSPPQWSYQITATHRMPYDPPSH
jgi:four helix bundle protein